MSFVAEHWYALASLLLSVVAIGIAICSSRRTSKDATRQIESIKKLAQLQIESSIKQVEMEIEKNQMQIDLAMQEIQGIKKIDESVLAYNVGFREQQVKEFNEKRPERICNVYREHTRNLNLILENLKKTEL